MTQYATEPPLGMTDFASLTPDERIRAVRTAPASAGAGETVRILLMLARPRTCVPSLLAFTLGWSSAGGTGVSWQLFVGLLNTVLFVLVANLYNTHTDLEEDSRNLPGRVWLVLRAGDRKVVLAAHAMSLTILLLSVLYGWQYLIAAALALLGTHQYSYAPLRLKARPVAGLLAFSLATFGSFLLGYFAAPDGVRLPDADGWQLFAFAVLWFVAKGTVKNLPDYDGDKEAGLRTSATVFAERATAARVATVLTMLVYLAPAVLVATGALTRWTLLALLWTAAAYVQCRAMALATDVRSANQVLKRDMTLSSLFLATVVVLNAPGWAAVSTVALGAVLMVGSDLVALDSRRDEDSAEKEEEKEKEKEKEEAGAPDGTAGPAAPDRATVPGVPAQRTPATPKNSTAPTPAASSVTGP
ncbi:UbiA family prenyltransferase [Streptomyces sp. NPDC050504]|uniref:UbiA family prenyltransferase n=1 Tax=Streptomyces sp. NPDC050504 TaxID=3365618 RepID=UPI0037A92420